jgi:hypothetical protein
MPERNQIVFRWYNHLARKSPGIRFRQVARRRGVVVARQTKRDRREVRKDTLCSYEKPLQLIALLQKLRFQSSHFVTLFDQNFNLDPLTLPLAPGMKNVHPASSLDPFIFVQQRWRLGVGKVKNFFDIFVTCSRGKTPSLTEKAQFET